MIRLFNLLLLSSILFACDGTNAQNDSIAPPPAAKLELNDKGRIDYSAVLTFADGPFAGTYELVKNADNQGSISLYASRADYLKEHPEFVNTTQLTSLNMTTGDNSFGIRNLSRMFEGNPAIGHLASRKWQGKNSDKAQCGSMQLVTEDAHDVIRHVYVEFLDCNGLSVTGFGDEYHTSKYTQKSKRPVAANFSERVRIEDINSTDDTQAVHETTMTLSFIGAHTVLTE